MEKIEMLKKIVFEKIKVLKDYCDDDMHVGELTVLFYIQRLLDDEKFLVDRYKFWTKNT